MGKYKVSYTPTYGAPTITQVIEADSQEEANLKVPKYFSDMAIQSTKKISSDNEKIYINTK